ncbi:MAG: PEP-CTERM sorting domain-containing protein [Candidatus Manganitrophaceae bacterium]|nr:MAG: PEP-CTERM sorting domain-containing protein [Candidatus Manganitrophaceae bacterium]
MLHGSLSMGQEQHRFTFLTVRLWAVVAAVTLTIGAAMPVWALSISQAYLLGDWSSPTSTSTAPFAVNGASGFQLSLNSLGVATSATAVSGLSIQVTDRFYYQSNTGTVDPNEVTSSQLASRINSEIAKLDDVGVISPEADAALNIDFTSGASVTLRTATTSVPVTGLILFEDAGLDPFSLRYCYNAACTQSDLLFNGFNSSTTSTLLASNTFGTDDVAPGIDQAYWFVFDQAVTGGYFKIGDTQNFGGNTTERLEVDYLGVTTARASVPEPSTLLLLGAALMALPFLRKMKLQSI